MGTKFLDISKEIFNLNIPILGICYGLQLIVRHFKGKVKTNIKKREFGRALLFESKGSLLTKGFFHKHKSKVWMSHQDSVYKIPKEFVKIASTKESPVTIIENKKKIYMESNFILKQPIQKMEILFLKISFLISVKPKNNGN